jgi:hypothetical protein
MRTSERAWGRPLRPTESARTPPGILFPEGPAPATVVEAPAAPSARRVVAQPRPNNPSDSRPGPELPRGIDPVISYTPVRDNNEAARAGGKTDADPG